MTFIERVRAIEAKELGSANVQEGWASVDDLRKEVCKRLPLETIALIMVDNPERAKSELRAAARAVMVQDPWVALPASRRGALIEELVDAVFGMGPIDALVSDESISEIMINGSQSVYFERDGKLMRSETSFDNDQQVRVLIDRIVGPLGRRVDESSPMVNARLPQGHRVNAIIPPISLDGPVLTIRAFTRHAMTLDEMQRRGSMGADVAQFLAWLVVGKKNVVVSGGTGSGKTTLLNALSCLIPPDERIITIEDSAELKFEGHSHVVRLEGRPKNAEGEGEVTIRQLVVNALRMRPDRIVVGECRGGEALDMLQAMLTGHQGSLTTLHANSPEDVVDRMITMVRYAVDLPVDAIEAQIGSAFDYVVQVSRAADGSRFVSEIAEVSFERQQRRCLVECVYEKGSLDPRGTWVKRPSCLADLVQQHVASEKEVERWEQLASGAY